MVAYFGSFGLICFDLEGRRLWAIEMPLTKSFAGNATSPAIIGDRVYFVKNGGILTCLDVKTGRRIYRTRTRGGGTHYASPIIADGKIYSAAGDGLISVLKSGAHKEILAVNDMQDGVYATPAIVDGTVYVRTHSALFAFREN